MTWLKKHWLWIVVVLVAALVLWRLWPKTPGVKRKITFFDLPIITGDAGPAPEIGPPSDDSIADKDESTMPPDSPSDLDRDFTLYNNG